ncbi:MAG: alkaline phosphatase D family protein [Thermoleophilia bacterium]|nr:alkaline phosphatase D family protein [Thermoleophilia bacterium]
MLTTRARLVPLAVLIVMSGALAFSPGASAKSKGFKFGVATGDVSAKSAILWARSAKQGKALIQVTGAKGGFKQCKLKKAPAKFVVQAKKSNDLTVQKRIYKLRPGTSYKYRFCMSNGRRSETGKFKTAPKQGQQKKIRFALSGDQDARPIPGGTEPYWNKFQVWNRIRAQNNDFNVLMGDTIYSDTEVPGYKLKDVAVSVKQKRTAYKTNLGMKPWTNARGSAAYYAHWDDHEFLNDFSQAENTFPYSNDGVDQGSTDISGKKLYKQGVQAFTDYNPITYKKSSGIYRSERWGKNLEIFFLDERSFRSSSADYGGACDNPAGSGTPDLAPTAPQSTRNVFAALIPALANPVPPDCLDAINDPSRTMLGSNQLKTFKNAVKNSSATFKVIFNEVPIQQYYALPYDRWEGYEAERKALLHFLQDNVRNVVFLTTDVHANLVNDARYNTLGPDGVQDSGILDVTTGPVATENYTGEINGATGNPSSGPLIQSVFLKSPPPLGVGMQCASTDQFSYAEVEVTRAQLKIDLLDDKDQPVLDTGDVEANPDATPCSQVVIPAE